MDFNLAEAGQFRANPEANGKNSIRIDSLTPGTPQEDTATIDATAITAWTGITYTGADGLATYSRFFKEENPTAEQLPYDVQVAEGADALKAALLYVIRKHENKPIVEVTVAGNNWTILHVGAGTLGAVFADGASQALSRGAITGLSVGEDEGDVVVTAEAAAEGGEGGEGSKEPAATATAVGGDPTKDGKKKGSK